MLDQATKQANSTLKNTIFGVSVTSGPDGRDYYVDVAVEKEVNLIFSYDIFAARHQLGNGKTKYSCNEK